MYQDSVASTPMPGGHCLEQPEATPSDKVGLSQMMPGRHVLGTVIRNCPLGVAANLEYLDTLYIYIRRGVIERGCYRSL